MERGFEVHKHTPHGSIASHDLDRLKRDLLTKLGRGDEALDAACEGLTSFTELAARGLARSHEADRATLLRRATYGVTGLPPTLVLALAGVWGMGWHMLWQMQRLDIDDPGVCLRLFRSNRDAGLIPALFFAFAALV